jgi:hypothetical protein
MAAGSDKQYWSDRNNLRKMCKIYEGNFFAEGKTTSSLRAITLVPVTGSRSNSPTLTRSANVSIEMFRPLSKISVQSREY